MESLRDEGAGITCLPVGGLEAGQERVDVNVGQLLGPVHLSESVIVGRSGITCWPPSAA